MTLHLLAGAAAAGAWTRWSLGGLVAIAGMVVAARWRRPVLLAGASFLAVAWWSASAYNAYQPPPAAPVDGWVTLTSDPRPSGTVGVRATATWGSHRVSVTAHGPLGGRLDDRLAGEQVEIVGSFRPARAGDGWARWRHEVGSISIVEIRGDSTGSPLSAFTNRLRRTLAGGADSLDRDTRAVFAGMVLGDDREQSAVVADDFRAAGLGHLLVVSGQNVAFVIALLGPLTRRLRPAGRLGVVVATLIMFVTLTRFEASVLRAAVMAGVSVGAAVLGGPIDGRRALSASIIGLLLVDPFLVRVLAFQLSVLATGGIVWLSKGLEVRLVGPLAFRTALATTISAQLAVSPLLVATFGPVPLAALPANVVAGPMSGPIMIWGCTAGLVAGLVPVAASAIHIPTAVMVGWVRWVASTTASLPFVGIGGVGVVVAVIAAGLGSSRRSVQRYVGAALCVFVVGTAVADAPRLGRGSTSLPTGVTAHRGAIVVLELDDPSRPRDVLESLRLAGVHELSFVIATDGDRADADVVVALRARFDDFVVVAPELHRVPGGQSLIPGRSIRIDTIQVTGERSGDLARLVVGPCRSLSCDDARFPTP